MRALIARALRRWADELDPQPVAWNVTWNYSTNTAPNGQTYTFTTGGAH